MGEFRRKRKTLKIVAFVVVIAVVITACWAGAVYIKKNREQRPQDIERNPFALLCKEEQCVYIDKDGYIFEKAPYFSGEIFLKFFDERDNNQGLALNRVLLSKDQFENINKFKDLINHEEIYISAVFLKNDGNFEFKTTEGWLIKLDERNDQKISFENLKISLEQEIKEKRKDLDYIDLRFGNKVFYKFK